MSVDAALLQAAGPVADPLAGDGAFDAVAGAVPSVGEVQDVSVGHGGSLTSDVALFGDSLKAARQLGTPVVSPAVAAMMEPLENIDRRASALGESSRLAKESGDELTPGEILDLTVRSQEFMFHSTLTANIANRTAEGLQQLFRQQG